MSNPIEESSIVYKSLLRAYRIKDKRKRFAICYKVVDRASYKEIHYIISMLKEAGFDDVQMPTIGTIDFSAILSIFNNLFANDTIRRQAYLLDILEEARERKRPSI